MNIEVFNCEYAKQSSFSVILNQEDAHCSLSLATRPSDVRNLLKYTYL